MIAFHKHAAVVQRAFKQYLTSKQRNLQIGMHCTSSHMTITDGYWFKRCKAKQMCSELHGYSNPYTYANALKIWAR